MKTRLKRVLLIYLVLLIIFIAYYILNKTTGFYIPCIFHELTGLDYELWDERCTTVSAHQYLNVTNTRGKKRKAVVDAVAAVIILESYLGYRKNQGRT